MFIEKLTKDEIKELAELLDLTNGYSITLIQYVGVYGLNKWSIALKCNGEFLKEFSLKERETVAISDFDISADLYINKNTFKSFMYKKFGEAYKQAYNEVLKKKYEEEMIK